MKAIARHPKDANSDDEYCSVCHDDNVAAVIVGAVNCYYCGNQINLCSKCYGRMQREFEAMNIGI